MYAAVHTHVAVAPLHVATKEACLYSVSRKQISADLFARRHHACHTQDAGLHRIVGRWTFCFCCKFAICCDWPSICLLVSLENDLLQTVNTHHSRLACSSNARPSPVLPWAPALLQQGLACQRLNLWQAWTLLSLQQPAIRPCLHSTVLIQTLRRLIDPLHLL